MRREEFLKELEYLLRDIPASEREDALAYYENYFDEAGAENEYQVIQELGSPASVAEKILADTQHNTKNQYDSKTETKPGMTKGMKILIVILIILTFPLWIGIVAGLFGAIIGIIGGAFGIAVGLIAATIALVVGGIGILIGGIMQVMLYPAEGLVCIGVGAILAALGILLGVLCAWCLGVWLPKGIRKLIHWIKGLVHRKEGGDEI